MKKEQITLEDINMLYKNANDLKQYLDEKCDLIDEKAGRVVYYVARVAFGATISAVFSYLDHLSTISPDKDLNHNEVRRLKSFAHNGFISNISLFKAEGHYWLKADTIEINGEGYLSQKPFCHRFDIDDINLVSDLTNTNDYITF